MLVRQSCLPSVDESPLEGVERRVHPPAPVCHVSERAVSKVQARVVLSGLDNRQRLLEEGGQPVRRSLRIEVEAGDAPWILPHHSAR